jgi:hypothetical protein
LRMNAKRVRAASISGRRTRGVCDVVAIKLA